MFQMVVPAVEKWDVADLTATSRELENPDLTAIVEKDAAWNPVGKESIIATGPKCLAEVLEQMGIGSDKAHWVVFLFALTSIGSSRAMLAAKLTNLVAEHRRQKAAQEKPAGA